MSANFIVVMILRMHAYSALDLAVGVLSEFQLLEGKLYAPGQGWGDPIGYSGLSPLDPTVRWSIQLTDESAKLSLKKISKKDLVNLLQLCIRGEVLLWMKMMASPITMHLWIGRM